MKTLPINPPKGSLEDIANQALIYGPERVYDEAQILHSIRIVETLNGYIGMYKLLPSQKEIISKLIKQHQEAVYSNS